MGCFYSLFIYNTQNNDTVDEEFDNQSEITTIELNKFINIKNIDKIFEQKKYYKSEDGFLYSINIPYYQSINHLPTTGPLQCFDCHDNGVYNNVFYKYCENCEKKYVDAYNSDNKDYGIRNLIID